MITDSTDVAPEPGAAALAVILQHAALTALDAVHLDDARRLAGETITAATAAFGSDSPEVANVILTAAMAEEAAGEFRAAQTLAQRAAAVAAPLANTDEPELMSLWADIEVACARLLCTLGEFDRAEARLGSAARAAGRILARTDQSMLSIDNMRAVTAKYAGRFDQAEIHYRRIQSVLETQSPCDEGALASVLHNLGGLNHSRGRYAEGLAHAHRGLQLRVKAVGPQHPDVARDLNAIGALHHDAGDAVAADAAYRQALAIFERTLGPAHHEVGMTCANLAVAVAAAGDPEEARRLYDRALTILEASVGAGHPDVALVQHNLAVLLADQGNPEAALLLLERADAALATSLPAGHPRRVDLRMTVEELSARLTYGSSA